MPEALTMRSQLISSAEEKLAVLWVGKAECFPPHDIIEEERSLTKFEENYKGNEHVLIWQILNRIQVY